MKKGQAIKRLQALREERQKEMGPLTLSRSTTKEMFDLSKRMATPKQLCIFYPNGI
jgi:hypothetical protein